MPNKTPQETRILLLDDDALVALNLADDLRVMGFELVRVVHNLADAWQVVTESPPHIALLDVHLTDGISLPVAEVLQRRGIPVVFISADLDARKSYALGSRPLLLKPFSPEQLRLALIEAAGEFRPLGK